MQAALRPGDQVITAYRDHGHMLATGMDPKGVMAELTGRAAGYSRGKGGSMHMFSREKNFFGGHGIVGAQVPIGTGLAFADKYLGNGAVTLTYFGDGAANQGGRNAVTWSRSGNGPIILEMKTYRYRGHSMSDPAKYRSREEVQTVREKRDPIDHYGQRLVSRGFASEDELKAIDKQIRQIVNMAAEFATESSEPAPSELYTDVIA
jgi:pyruvate dehydrogenase E1 component alpha subunit